MVIFWFVDFLFQYLAFFNVPHGAAAFGLALSQGSPSNMLPLQHSIRNSHTRNKRKISKQTKT
jgi:hypothetical protein